jgi:hypothetical protein
VSGNGERARLDRVRGELQRLGYLSHRFERFLLSDALAPRGGFGGLARLAAKVGLAAGSLVAAANALALAVANRLFGGAAADLPLLVAHVAPPVVAGTAAGFLAVALLFRGLLALFPRRGLDFARLGAALGATALLFGAGLWLAAGFLLALPPSGRSVAAAALLAAAAAVAKLLADGLLAFAIRWTHDVPHERLVPRRAVALAAGGGAAAVAAATLLVSPAPRPVPPASLPSAPGERVVLLALDGVLADELDFELSRGGLPALARLARAGGIVASYRRAEGASPPEIWTTFATGRSPAGHGVVALDGFRPAGMRATLARTGPWRLWFERVAAPLGLAEQRPLLAGRRRAPAVWELVARGGRPVAAINWWGTYPAEPLPGLVVAHGAYELFASGAAAGAVAPEERAGEVARLAAERGADAGAALADLPPAARAPLLHALAADRFHRTLARATAGGARAVAVYLPALDLVAHAGTLGAPRFGELVRSELLAADALADALVDGETTFVALFDPGRRGGGGEGRALVFRRGGCAAASRPRIAPESVAAALLRAAGLPQSGELPEPPAFCAWPEPPARVATYGERSAAEPARADDAAYLENLRSLGYL